MDFEWDEAKSEKNLRERGFGFESAVLIFDGPVLDMKDSRKDYGETCVRAIGSTGGNILFVVYTDRGDVRRLVSVRLANQKERAQWRSFVNR